MQTVVETPSYVADAERLFSLEERRAIVDRLASDPTCGVVIPGSGGIRKVRFGFGARGKSGGARIIYMFSGVNLPVFILAAFAKNEKANLSAAERNALARMVATMIEGIGDANDKDRVQQDQGWSRGCKGLLGGLR